MSAVAGRVIGLLGPTGVGKTAVAVELARLLGVNIISCDSMQVYAGFPVLTNQPWRDEDRPELHRLVGVVDPGMPISAADYARMARPLVEGEMAEHGWALVVGGSGLYMRAALAPLAALGPADTERRSRLERRAQAEGTEALHSELAGLDPDAAASIDHRNARRVIRAIEGVMSAGGSWSGRGDLWEPAYYHPTLIVGVSLDRTALAERILVRTERMIEAGAVDEVARFCEERGEEVARPGGAGICSAIGYAELWQHCAGELGMAETVEQIASATRGYARRQMTWLRKVKGAVMIEREGQDAGEIAQQIVALAESAFETKEPCAG